MPAWPAPQSMKMGTTRNELHSPPREGFGDWTFAISATKGGSDRHSCLSNSSLMRLKTGKNACLY